MIEWMYPVRCPVCFEIVMPKGELLHSCCAKKLVYLEEPICKKCGSPVTEEEEYCAECLVSDRGWDEGRSVFEYHGVARRALRQVKKEGTKELVRFFVQELKQSQRDFIRRAAPQCIVPVPLHPTKQRIRGFNQAELLARALGEELGIPVRLLLKKVNKTKDQKSLNRVMRKRNVKDAFVADRQEWGQEVPETVLLLDDVVTTGSTLTACALALKEQGVKRVVFLTVCAGGAQS